jgi:hypothetical protein
MNEAIPSLPQYAFMEANLKAIYEGKKKFLF